MDVYDQHGNRIGRTTDADEEAGFVIGRIIRGIFRLSPTAFLTTAMVAWTVYGHIPFDLFAHPFIWGFLLLMVAIAIFEFNLGVVLVFLPYAAYAYFPNYTWAALLLLWIVMMIIGNFNKSDSDGEPQT